MQSVAELHDRPGEYVSVAPGTLGAGSRCQATPSHPSAMTSDAPPVVSYSSTAMQAVAAAQDTSPSEKPEVPAMTGSDSTCQELPSHRSAIGSFGPSPFHDTPVAVHAVADEHDTAPRAPPV